MTEIRVPTRALHGLTDVLVPRQHGEWLAHNVPNADAVIDEQGGHMTDPNLVTERVGWLVQPVSLFTQRLSRLTEAAFPAHDWRARAFGNVP